MKRHGKMMTPAKDKKPPMKGKKKKPFPFGKPGKPGESKRVTPRKAESFYDTPGD